VASAYSCSRHNRQIWRSLFTNSDNKKWKGISWYFQATS